MANDKITMLKLKRMLQLLDAGRSMNCNPGLEGHGSPSQQCVSAQVRNPPGWVVEGERGDRFVRQAPSFLIEAPPFHHAGKWIRHAATCRKYHRRLSPAPCNSSTGFLLPHPCPLSSRGIIIRFLMDCLPMLQCLPFIKRMILRTYLRGYL